MEDASIRNLFFKGAGSFCMLHKLFAPPVRMLCLQSNAGMRHMPGKYLLVVVFDRRDIGC